MSKTHSTGHSVDINIWLYGGEMLTFENGFETQITTNNRYSNPFQILIEQYPCWNRLQNL